MPEPKNLDRDYDHHPPRSAEEAHAHTVVRARFGQLAEHLEREVPPGRELALAHTHLETAMMWANAAIARARYDRDHGASDG